MAFLDDRTLLVVDEASMVDLGQFTEPLIDHLPAGCHVLLVGNRAQLPPIGPGLVLPMLYLHSIHKRTREYMHRSCTAGTVISN